MKACSIRLRAITLASVWLAGLLLATAVPAVIFPDSAKDEKSEPDYKWIQHPDLSFFGMDVDAMKLSPHLLADDFLCTRTGAITNIVIWGSWMNDLLPFDNPNNVIFSLSFHADVPAGVEAPWSMPGETLWVMDFAPGTFQSRIEMDNLTEGWYMPSSGLWIPIADHVCWRYEFPVNLANAFVQTGSVARPIVYWLDVQAFPLDQGLSRFGWKTSQEHWNDDACWAPAVETYNGYWWEMRYPQGHELQGQSIDLAFALSGTSEPEQGLYDFGDAPDGAAGTGPSDYQTTLADGGAYHLVVAGAPYFDDVSQGDQPDTEPDGQPDPLARAGASPDDEDGIQIPVLRAGQTAAITVTVDDGAGGGGAGGGFVDAWIDYNTDGDWTDSGEHIWSGWLPQGANVIYTFVPSGASLGQTFSRFRINSQAAGLAPTGGPAVDGEVEDHEAHIEPPNAEEPLKWLQPPDLTPNGFDVACMKNRPILLADDFLCRARSLITNIVVWGSWFHDILPTQQGLASPSNVTFTVSLHADVPAGVQAPWSMPGQTLWLESFPPGTFKAEQDSIDNLVEGWYDPVVSNWTPVADWTCWRYEFPVDIARAFMQTGTVDNPVVYWLDVQATPHDILGEAQFGWKCTLPAFRWNDDACWTPHVEPYNGANWTDMHYPPPHPHHRGYTDADSFDLAFALFSEPLIEAPNELDWGDAPDGPYPTLSASNGACHLIGGPWLGGPADAPDGEFDGQPDPYALGDDGDGNDDENGVAIPAVSIVGLSTSFGFTVSGAAGLAYVEMWVDWDGNGSWLDAGEYYAGWFPNGPASIAMTVPLNAVRGQTFARFRISSAGVGTPYGPAQDGEVEDHALIIEERFDFGDAPDPRYPTLLASGGACHIAVGPWLGDASDAPDIETDGQPAPNALGDDGDGNDDENGVVFPGTLVAGTVTNVAFYVTNAVGLACVELWIDWNANGSWLDPGDACVAGWCGNGWNVAPVSVPAAVAWGISFARVRISSAGTGSPIGLAYDGEVEDYAVLLAGLDFGDAPESGTAYPTTLARNGARHLLRGLVWMCPAVDSETDGQPTVAADGDDNAGIDDEDGVTLPTYIRQNRTESLSVNATAVCKLNAWIDYNGNGSWFDAGEQVFNDVTLSAGTNALTIAVPPDAAVGTTFARFRVSSAGGDTPTGQAEDGEVEDYAIEVRERFPPKLGTKWRQPPDLKYGINLQSWSAPDPITGTNVGPVVAEDWWCDGRPINAIRWWGSYVLYGGPTNNLSVARPAGFRLSWYLDRPTNTLGGAFSRPGPLLRQTVVTLAPEGQRPENLDEAVETYLCTVPLDFLGPAYAGLTEHKFEYIVVLSEPWMEKNTFARESYDPSCSSNVYWLAIEALYDTPPTVSEHPWGWETTPYGRNWNDAAVTSTNTTTGSTPWTDLTYVPPVDPWVQATQHPSLNGAANMSFAMLTEVIGHRDTKWSQLPNMELGTDLASWRYADPDTPPVGWAAQALRADDFVSDGRRITDIHWWGSYIGWQGAYFRDEFDPMPAPEEADERPLGFDLSWHLHDAAGDAPGVLITNIFVPFERCHEMYYCTIPQLGTSPYAFEHEYQYYVDLLDEKLDTRPWYEEYGGHYWLNVQAVFRNDFVPAQPGTAGPASPHEGWGWKIADIEPDFRLARSVVSNYASSVDWEASRLPTWHLEASKLHDLAFELTTDNPRTNAVIRLLSIRRLTNGVVQVTSTGTGGAGMQRLQRRPTLSPTSNWETVETDEAPYPPPAATLWERQGSTQSNEFYRVIESSP